MSLFRKSRSAYNTSPFLPQAQKKAGPISVFTTASARSGQKSRAVRWRCAPGKRVFRRPARAHKRSGSDRRTPHEIAGPSHRVLRAVIGAPRRGFQRKGRALHYQILSVSGRRGKPPPLSSNCATPRWRGKFLQWSEILGLSVGSWAFVERNARLDPIKSVELTGSSPRLPQYHATEPVMSPFNWRSARALTPLAERDV